MAALCRYNGLFGNHGRSGGYARHTGDRRVGKGAPSARLGRGSHQSYCILVSDAKNKEALGRLGIMCKTTDGFAIAEFDLKQRGPGDFFGHKQHGLPELKIADMMNDIELINLTKNVSESLLEQDPDLSHAEHRGLREMTEQLFSHVGDAGLN